MTSDITFDTFCVVLSKLHNTSDQKILIDYINSVRHYGQDTLYIIMKFLLPDYDKRIYNVKRTTLAKYIINAFSLHPTGPDARSLLQLNKYSSNSRDIGLLIYTISKKLFKTAKNNITLSQVDDWLTLISNGDIKLVYTILPGDRSEDMYYHVKYVLS